MNSSSTFISVVIPVYQAEECLVELYARLKKSLNQITDRYEIVLVDDSSQDRSWQVMSELAANDKCIKAIHLSRNFGQHYAITAGLDYSRGDWVVVMDCDLQDRPEEIPRLYEKSHAGYDVVLANREKRVDSIPKRMSSWLFYKVFNYLSGLNYNYQVANFCIISRKVADQYKAMCEQSRFFGGQLRWMGFNVGDINVQHDKRFAGTTTYTLRKSLTLAVDTIIAYSDKPLRISVKFGFLIAFSAFLWAVYILFHTVMYGTTVTGWSSLMVSIYLIGGIIIANLGIIGIYLGKAFDETKKRPLYIVAKTLNVLNHE